MRQVWPFPRYVATGEGTETDGPAGGAARSIEQLWPLVLYDRLRRRRLGANELDAAIERAVRVAVVRHDGLRHPVADGRETPDVDAVLVTPQGKVLYTKGLQPPETAH